LIDKLIYLNYFFYNNKLIYNFEICQTENKNKS